jgi:signal transduction histidine kinase/CheY-like chemotaxis protein
MPGILPQFLRELGYVLLEHRDQGMFVPLFPLPAWLAELWEIPQQGQAEIPIAEKSPFLENFLCEADTFWNSSDEGLCQSETWIEKSPSGKEIPVQAVAVRLDGRRYLALQSPEPQFRERAQLLQTARNSLLSHEKLQREIQKKEILLHCIIHDLSQPLSVMSVALDSLADERVSKRGKGLLELGRKASDQQSSMIRDVLQVFSADLKASLEAESTADLAPDLLHCAQAVLEGFRPVYAAKNVRLLVDERTDEKADWRVRGEETRIKRIFSNLLENALRYASAGSRVTIGVESEGEFVKAFVDDEGPGLPSDLSSAQIFALFSKGKEGGGKAGLGLYFCRLTVERWGGAIGCASLPGKGSRFWFRLPRAAPQGEIPGKTAELQRVSQSPPLLAVKRHPMRILLADDQKEIRLLTTHQLERNGHHVVAVGNGQEALEAIQRERFDVILMDEEMPVMNGLEALRAIREREKEHGRMVLIALTGYNTEPDRERLLRAGFDSVIGKPFRLSALDALLKGSPENVLGAEKKDPGRVPAQTPLANLLERVGGDEKLARKIISTFLRDTPARMAGIQRAIQKKDGGSLASISHALKGSVSIFGAQEAREHAQKLQELGRAKDFRGLARFHEQLKEEIAELEANLRGYAGQRSSASAGASPKRNRRSSSPKRKRP